MSRSSGSRNPWTDRQLLAALLDHAGELDERQVAAFGDMQGRVEQTHHVLTRAQRAWAEGVAEKLGIDPPANLSSSGLVPGKLEPFGWALPKRPPARPR